MKWIFLITLANAKTFTMPEFQVDPIEPWDHIQKIEPLNFTIPPLVWEIIGYDCKKTGKHRYICTEFPEKREELKR